MDPYIVLLTGLGVVILAIAWLPLLLRNAPLSLPIFCVMLGIGLFMVPGTGPDPNFLVQSSFVERITELVVIIALLGAGLKLDRPMGWKNWRTTWLLLGVTMPLSILGITLLSMWILGLPLPAAILLGAVLAPTDPVLAADIQVGPPRSGGEDEVRFSLTSEAGLNDGLAFPFTNFAIAMAASGGRAGEPRMADAGLVDGGMAGGRCGLETGRRAGGGLGGRLAAGLAGVPVAGRDADSGHPRGAGGTGDHAGVLRRDRTGPWLRVPGGIRRGGDAAPYRAVARLP